MPKNELKVGDWILARAGESMTYRRGQVVKITAARINFVEPTAAGSKDAYTTPKQVVAYDTDEKTIRDLHHTIQCIRDNAYQNIADALEKFTPAVAEAPKAEPAPFPAPLPPGLWQV